jgi:hypothetical protein
VYSLRPPTFVREILVRLTWCACQMRIFTQSSARLVSVPKYQQLPRNGEAGSFMWLESMYGGGHIFIHT